MERTPLITAFVCVATSGRTADGREITAQQLQEMAESYDPKLYTANIWLEHYRWRNFGQVLELESREEDGKTKLYAKLAPSLEMIELNKQGQKLFTSVEITPNFAETGKYYLSGLGITDSPASTGTTALMFSRIGSQSVQTGNSEPLALTFSSTEQESDTATDLLRSFWGWLFNQQKPQKEKVEPTFATNGNPEQQEEKMNKEEMTQLIETTVAAVFAKQTTAAEQTAEPETAKNTVSREEFAELQQQHAELQAKFNALSKTEVTEVPNGANGLNQPAQAFSIDTAI